MEPVPVFVSFDFEHDLELKNGLIEQSSRPGFPVRIRDMSIKHSTDERWKEDARRRISGSGCLLVLCGRNTHSAPGVTVEVQLAHQLGIPIVLLRGRHDGASHPTGVSPSTQMHSMDWSSIARILPR